MKANTDILVIDVETTGVDPLKHACIEIGAVLLDRDLNPLNEFSATICPWEGAEVQPEAMAVNRITLADLEHAPNVTQVVEQFHQAFQPETRKLMISGWNIWFDMGFLRMMYQKANRSWPFRQRLLDVQSIVTFHSDITPRSQAEAARMFLNEEQSHRALGDARQTARILKIAAEKFRVLPTTA